jgi:hypothetical protein
MESGPDAKTFIPASVMLQELHDEAPAGHVTLDWVTGTLHKQSFGLIMLVLAIVGAAPGISLVGGLLLLFPAFQMAAGRTGPVFPHWIAERALPTRHLGAVVQRAIPILRFLEKSFYPRYPTPLEATKRIVGIMIMMLSARLILSPIPLSNMLPAVVIALISLAYLEEDGLMLSIGLLAGLIIVGLDLGVVWEIAHGARRIRLSI